jgi:hypothetical protein
MLLLERKSYYIRASFDNTVRACKTKAEKCALYRDGLYKTINASRDDPLVVVHLSENFLDVKNSDFVGFQFNPRFGHWVAHE